MKRFIVDRIEGDRLVLECENGEHVNLELSSLPKHTAQRLKEGDVLRFEENSCFLDEAETENRRSRIALLMKDVFSD